MLRNRHFRQGTRSKRFVPGGKAWAEAVGYHQRSLVETAMSGLRALGGHRLRSRREGTQAMEALLSMELLNLHAAGGLPEREHRAWETCA